MSRKTTNTPVNTNNNKKKNKRSFLKGYLPVPVQWSSSSSSNPSYLYVKEHRDATTTTSRNSTTLFVVNVPLLFHAKEWLQLVLGTWGDIQSITLASHWHQQQHSNVTSASGSTMTGPSFLNPSHSATGKFAHVVYETPKDLKRTLQALQNEQVTLEGNDSLLHDPHRSRPNAVLDLAERYRSSIPDPDKLLQKCNQIMEEFEESTELWRQQQQKLAEQPDADGFVTVAYGNSTTVEPHTSSDGRRRRRSSSSKPRTQKKKKKKTAELTDFYRFQTKQRQQDAWQTLREQFQHDLDQLKERQAERPFGE